MVDAKRHFCTCGDTACPLNPNNPNLRNPNMGCDGCIRKNLALGEVPSCIFKRLGSTEGWDDYSVEGFARFVALNPRSEEERERCARLAREFDDAHATPAE